MKWSREERNAKRGEEKKTEQFGKQWMAEVLLKPQNTHTTHSLASWSYTLYNQSMPLV